MVMSPSMTRSSRTLRFFAKAFGEHPVTLEQVAQALSGSLVFRCFTRCGSSRKPSTIAPGSLGRRRRSSTIRTKPSPRNLWNVPSMVSGDRFTHRSSMSMAANSLRNGQFPGAHRQADAAWPPQPWPCSSTAPGQHAKHAPPPPEPRAHPAGPHPGNNPPRDPGHPPSPIGERMTLEPPPCAPGISARPARQPPCTARNPGQLRRPPTGKAASELGRMGVEIHCQNIVTGVDAIGVEVKGQDGTVQRISSRVKIWPAGVHGHHLPIPRRGSASRAFSCPGSPAS